MEMILPYQPGSYSRLLKYSFILYAVSFKRVIGLAFILALITFVPRLLSIAIGQDIFLNVPMLSPYRLWLLLIELVGLMIFVAILWRMHCITKDIHEPIIQDFLIGFKKALYIIVASIIQCAIVFTVTALIYSMQLLLQYYHLLFSTNLLGMIVTFIVFFGEGILILYVSTLFIFLIPIIAIEEKGIFSAIKRSIFLVWNHWWRVFSLQLTPWVCYLFVMLIIRYAFNIQINIYFLGYGPHNTWVSFLQLVLFTLFLPWLAALMIVQVRDLELRKHITQKDKNAI